MKKVIYWIVNVLEVALLIGAGLVNYYTPRRMGMFRFVGYKNMMWEERYNLQAIKSMAMIGIIILAIVTIAMYFIKDKNVKTSMILLTVLLTVFYVGFSIFNTVDTYKAFYFISPMIGLVALLQILKTLISILLNK